MTTESAPRRAGRGGTRHPAPRLDSLEAVRRELAAVYRAARRGDMDSRDATRLAYVLDRIANLIEASDIEARITAIEGSYRHEEN